MHITCLSWCLDLNTGILTFYCNKPRYEIKWKKIYHNVGIVTSSNRKIVETETIKSMPKMYIYT